MNIIEIKWTYDEHDCDTCGISWSEGAVVTDADGKVILDLEPHAHCFNNRGYSREEVFMRLLAELGYTISTVEPIYDRDDNEDKDYYG